MNDAAHKTLKPLTISRTFHSPRERVFKAWTSADAVKRWFAPTGYTIPEATVDPRVDGAFEVLMRSPAGEQHWARGVFKEVSEPNRLVIDFTVEDAKGHKLFSALTEADFSNAQGETRLDVTQTYTVLDPESAWMAEGAPQGWAQTLDNLSAELRRTAPTRSTSHGVFTVSRAYDAPVARVWRALSDKQAKAKWFGGNVGQWQEIERAFDFRVGGRERVRGRWESGVVSSFDAVYHDIVPNARIVYSYSMHLDEAKISVSLATMQLKAENAGRTTLSVTEQGAFLDGYEDDGSREKGTAFLLERIGESL